MLTFPSFGASRHESRHHYELRLSFGHTGLGQAARARCGGDRGLTSAPRGIALKKAVPFLRRPFRLAGDYSVALRTAALTFARSRRSSGGNAITAS
jgi:hypothetical protein